MSARPYTVPKDERLDRIALALYGTERRGTVEALLDANVGLAEVAHLVPAGTVLTVPTLVAAAVPGTALTRPWDA